MGFFMRIIKLGLLLICVFGFSNLSFGCHESALKPNDRAAQLAAGGALKHNDRVAQLAAEKQELEAQYKFLYEKETRSIDSDDERDNALGVCYASLAKNYAELEKLGLFVKTNKK